MVTPADIDCLPSCVVQEEAIDDYEAHDAVLQVVSSAAEESPYQAAFAAASKRRDRVPAEGASQATLITLPSGTVVVRLVWPVEESVFMRAQACRALIKTLLSFHPRTIAVDVRVESAAAEVLYAVLVGTAVLPGASSDSVVSLVFASSAVAGEMALAAIQASANIMARALTQLPPNRLTPATFSALAQALAVRAQLAVTTYDAAALADLGAGAMMAVGRASENTPLLVRIAYCPQAATRTVAVVGKGVCFDTGGVNVKPARYMRGMSGDMAGAAVALAVVMAAAKSSLPVAVTAWLVLAQNDISATAYRPDEVITALNGKRIEVVHTDAEGRMMLADALTLAGRDTPDLLVSLATLTGTMQVALGTRMSGFFSTSALWRERALQAASESGERLWPFPLPDDYRTDLDSQVADIKQCHEEADADHILAALFLQSFIAGKQDWLHVDLSASDRKEGIGAVPGRHTGFGAAWLLTLLRTL